MGTRLSLKKEMRKEYHIYFKKRCLFKSIDEEKFDMIWSLLNTEYNTELSYEEMTVNHTEERELQDSSY